MDTPLAFPDQLTTFTYILNVENVDNSTLHMRNIRDILPQGGFRYLLNSASYKVTDTPFDPENDNFAFLEDGILISDSDLEATILGNNRQELEWSDPGGGGDPKWTLAQAGAATDTLIVRFEVTASLKRAAAPGGAWYLHAWAGGRGVLLPLLVAHQRGHRAELRCAIDRR